MTELEKLVQTANELCERLEMASANDKMFCDDVCEALEVYSWETFRLANNINELKERFGG